MPAYGLGNAEWEARRRHDRMICGVCPESRESEVHDPPFGQPGVIFDTIGRRDVVTHAFVEPPEDGA